MSKLLHRQRDGTQRKELFVSDSLSWCKELLFHAGMAFGHRLLW